MPIKVLAGSNGDFRLDIDTDGVPEGEFLITAGGIERTVQIVLTEPTPTSTQRSPAITSTSENDKAQLLGRVTSVAINPLLFAFLTIVFFKVVEVL
jgi:hypothetical protein